MSEELLSPIREDVLREIASMGTAHAATSLSNIIGKKVTVSNLSVSWVDFQNVSDFIGGAENTISSALVTLDGQIQGLMLHLMEMPSATTIASLMLGQKVTIDTIFGDMEMSALTEFCNIMISSYLGSLAELLGSKIVPSVPYVSIDMANAVLSVPVAEYGRVADQILLIESKLMVVDTQTDEDFTGCFLFAPDMESFKNLLQALGVE